MGRSQPYLVSLVFPLSVSCDSLAVPLRFLLPAFKFLVLWFKLIVTQTPTVSGLSAGKNSLNLSCFAPGLIASQPLYLLGFSVGRVRFVR